MKIAITGSARGYGKALVDAFTNSGHTVIPLNRSDGYDISKEADRLRILTVLEKESPDVFINNAYCGFIQCDVFKEALDLYNGDTSKTIVNVNSRAALGAAGNNLYSAHKKSLKKTTNQLAIPGIRPRIINVYPGYIATEEILRRDSISPVGSIMSLEEAANIVVWACEQPQHIELANISFWAINKKRKTDK